MQICFTEELINLYYSGDLIQCCRLLRHLMATKCFSNFRSSEHWKWSVSKCPVCKHPICKWPHSYQINLSKFGLWKCLSPHFRSLVLKHFPHSAVRILHRTVLSLPKNICNIQGVSVRTSSKNLKKKNHFQSDSQNQAWMTPGMSNTGYLKGHHFYDWPCPTNWSKCCWRILDLLWGQLVWFLVELLLLCTFLKITKCKSQRKFLV